MNVALVLPIITPTDGGEELGGPKWQEISGRGGVGGGGVFARQPIFLIQSKIQISLYIWIYFRSIC